MKGKDGMDALFNPSSLALIGASNDERKAGGMFLKSLIEEKYQGKLYPINPREKKIMSLPSYPDLASVPDEVALAIFTIPNRFIPSALEQCARKGVRYVVVHSAGFGEIGGQGLELETEMLRIAGNGNLRIVGPNCMGVYSPTAGINTIVPGIPRPVGGGPEDQVRKVTYGGWIYYLSKEYRIPKAFKGYYVALRHTTEDGIMDVFFCNQKVAKIDLRDHNYHSKCVTHVPEHL